jgi:DNA-binding NtrC family response regulator
LLFRKFASDVAVSYKMPVISLDEGARRLLENYYWKGNIRQLKNVAEQISAIEEARVITEPILRKYLPATGADNTPVVMGQRTDDYSDERELLYKVLFDMKHDILDIKRMLMEVMSGEYGGQNGQPQPQGGGDVYGLLPSHSAPYAYAEEPQDAVGEEVTDEPAKPLTKEDVQREAIIKALRKSAGRRKDAAKELFMSERTLYRKIKELGIDEF